MKGCIISGKMTMSRTGIMGTRFTSAFSLLNIDSFGDYSTRHSPIDPGNAVLLYRRQNPATGFLQLV